MQCLRCGKEITITSGGNYHCPHCGFVLNDLVYRPSNCDIPLPQGFGKQEGWVCPVCGRGLAPWVSSCPCRSDFKITYGTSTYVNDQFDINEYAKEIYGKLMKSEGDINGQNINREN